MSQAKDKLEEFGALDQLNCLWYIPPGVKFVWARREICGIENIEIGVVGQAKGDVVSHGGGVVFFLKEDSETSSKDVPAHWPFVFTTPSFVTLSKQDILDLRIDNDDTPGLATTWPGVDELIKCPVCRKSAIPDERTVYILTGTQGLRMSRAGQLGAKLLWRFFCLDCFETLGTRQLYIPDEGFTEADMPQTVVPFLEQGLSAPFCTMSIEITPGTVISPPGGEPVPAYHRVRQFVVSGFHYCLSNDYNRYLTFVMGGSTKKEMVKGEGQTASFVSKCNFDKLRDQCCAPGCGKTATEVAREKDTLGEQKTRRLLQCSKCRMAKYCSKECQLAAWKSGHKQECKVLREQNAASSNGAK